MGKILRIVPLLIPLLALIGCEDYKQEFEPETNILALMVATSSNYPDSQFVLVDRSYSIMDSVKPPPKVDSMSLPPVYDYLDVDGIQGCNVRLKGNYATTFLGDTNPNRKGIYRSRMDFNDTIPYTLEVILPEGDTVTGTSYFPSKLRILAPAVNCTISLKEERKDSNRIYWNKCRNVSKYFVFLLDSRNDYLISSDYLPDITDDTSCVFFAKVPFEVQPRSYYILTLLVMGITSEYQNYLDPRSKGRGNLSSGYGVFTGITIDRHNVRVVE